MVPRRAMPEDDIGDFRVTPIQKRRKGLDLRVAEACKARIRETPKQKIHLLGAAPPTANPELALQVFPVHPLRLHPFTAAAKRIARAG